MNLWIEGAQRAVPLPETPRARHALLRQVVPVSPWVAVLPAAVLVGTTVLALALAVRANRRVKALEGDLFLDEEHEALHQQPLETISP